MVSGTWYEIPIGKIAHSYITSYVHPPMYYQVFIKYRKHPLLEFCSFSFCLPTPQHVRTCVPLMRPYKTRLTRDRKYHKHHTELAMMSPHILNLTAVVFSYHCCCSCSLTKEFVVTQRCWSPRKNRKTKKSKIRLPQNTRDDKQLQHMKHKTPRRRKSEKRATLEPVAPVVQVVNLEFYLC